MADFDSSLPVRTENNGDVAAKIVDGTIPSQALAVNADGSINVTDNGASLTVDAVDLDIRDLDSATDSVEAVQATHDNLNVNANIQVGDADVDNANPVPVSDAGGSLTVDAVDLDIRDLAFATDSVDVSGSSVTVTATDLDIRDLDSATDSVEVLQATHDNLNANANIQVGDADVDNANPVPVSDAGGSLTVDATDLDIRDLDFATDSVDVSGSSVTVTATDLDIRDLTHVSDSVSIGDGTDLLAINADGSINVVIADNTPGTPVNAFNTAAAVASGATSNHDYTVTALKTLHLNQIEASGSGKMKIEVQIESGVATGTFATRFVQFSSTAETNMSIHLENPIAVAAGVRVRVIRTNRDNQSQDVYSTISGYELP